MITMAACSDAPTSPSTNAFVPKATSFTVGDLVDPTADGVPDVQLGKLIICKAGNANGTFNLNTKAIVNSDSTGDPTGTNSSVTVDKGTCKVAIEDGNTVTTNGSNVKVAEVAADFTTAEVTACKFKGAGGSESNCVPALTLQERFFVNSYHGFVVVITNTYDPPPPPPSGCTYTQGYWKTHGPTPKGNNSNEWDLASIQLGTTVYTQAQALSIFNTPVAGNGLISLAHQLMAAKLNVANGVVDPNIGAVIAAADALIGSLVVPPVGTGKLKPADTSTLTGQLAAFNEGATGPGHCGDEVLVK
jgi:hypothetical protein